MNSFRYCAYKDDTQDGYNSCSRSGTELPIEVNCAGLMSIDHPFVTYNERGREDFYLMYIIEGALVFNFEKSTVMGAVGDYVIFPPRYKYKYTNTDGTVSYYFAHFTGSYVSQVLKELEIDGEPSLRHAGIPKATSDALSAMFAAWVREDRHAARLRGAYLETALVSLASEESVGDRGRIDTSLSYINAFYTNEISIPELAAMENLSVSRYNTVFRELMGVSPTKYILNLRMNHACSLLDGTNIAIGIIGESVGYPDKHFFSKTFKKHIGVSPIEYRKRGENNLCP